MNKKQIITRAKQLIDDVYPHFDVVVLWADADLSFLNYKKLTNMNAKKLPPHIEHEKMSFNSGLKYKLTLFQPSPENIQYLCDAFQPSLLIFL